MSFLFGKKKETKTVGGAPSSRDGPPAGGASSTIPTTNGMKGRDRGPSTTQSPTPGSSIDNSVNLGGGAHTPSPEHGPDQRGGPGQELQYGPRPGLNGPSPPSAAPTNLYPWSQRRLTFTSSQPNPFPRYGAAVNAVSSKEGDVYLMGGLVNGQTVKGDLWMIEAGGTNLACYPVGTTFEGPGPRVGHASLLVGNAFIVFGGDTKMDEGDKLDDTLYLLNTSTRHWSRSMPPGPRPAGRYGHTLNILGSKIYVFGGQVEGYFFNDLIAFDLNALQNTNSKWEMLIQNSNDGGPPEGSIPPARTNHTIVSWNDKLYLFGGTNGTQWFNDVWSYDPRTVAWTQLDCIGYIPAPREGHSAALVNDVMYIFGGRTEEGTDLGDLAAFRITSRRWYTFQNMGPSPSPRSGHSMTAYGKQIVVLAGEPSSAPRDPNELSLVYVLDTGKIRYPNDQQIQQTPSGERVPGNRRPSGERSVVPQSRGPILRDGAVSAAEGGPRRMLSGSRESMAGNAGGPGPMSGGRGQDPSIGDGPSPPGGSSRLPRASMAQAPSGPPPQQQAPPPRINGVIPPINGTRSKTPTKDGRILESRSESRGGGRGEGKGFVPYTDIGPGSSIPRENISPISRGSPGQNLNARSPSPILHGRHMPEPTQVQPGPGNAAANFEEPQTTNGGVARSPSRQAQQDFSDGIDEFPAPQSQQHRPFINQYDGADDANDHVERSESPVQVNPSKETTSQLEDLTTQNEKVLEELEALRSRNAWYASELALARKAGYQQSTSKSTLDEGVIESFGDDEKPLVEALIAMRLQLSEVQASVDSRVDAAAQQVAELEHQRDAAINEAVYAKAKLAAHGGSLSDTPQSENMSRGIGEDDRSNDMGRKLAAALTAQKDLRSTIESMTAEVQAEQRARELAEGTAEAAQRRVAQLGELHNPGELESLRTELHQIGMTARDEATQKAEAHSKAQLLEVERDDLTRRLDEALEFKKEHERALASLGEAVIASEDKSTLLETKLEEEREQRENVDRKLLQLRAEHEERTAELDLTTRKLRDAEDLAEKHASEAQKHREVNLSDLDNLRTRSLDSGTDSASDERVSVLKQEIEKAHVLVKKYQADADTAAEKLRSAEERIAGLEAYQEQSSRESLTTRKQLQDTVRELQALHAKHSTILQQLESHQRDNSALTVQHNALKELLDERGISDHGRSRNVDSPGSRIDTPEQNRLRELEQELEASQQAHQETKSAFETREQDADRIYREKLEQLEQDYQSAVHYVKGTEKMLKRMKDELTKYKTQNARLQGELEVAHRTQSERTIEPEAAAEWEQERQALRKEIGEMQQSVKESVSQLESQMEEIQQELYSVQEERDHYRQTNEQTLQQLSQTTHQARGELDQLKSENAMLESRALDAEHKVTLLLDQVGTSVGNYRRQSQQMHTNGHTRTLSSSSNTPVPRGGHSHSTSLSTINDSGASDTLPPDSRNSIALDSLASELETLRTHWEGTHRNYRLSNQFDFERTPTSPPIAGEGTMSDSLANWRKKLDREEKEKRAKSMSPEEGADAGRGSSPVIGGVLGASASSNSRQAGHGREGSRALPGSLVGDEYEEEGEKRDDRSYVI